MNSVREPTPQKISTGRPSQPQRPPESMQEFLPLGTMHFPLFSQPNVKPQRCPEGHCESFLQLSVLWEPRKSELPVGVVCAWVLLHATTNPRTNATPYSDTKQNFPITSDRYPFSFLRRVTC